MEPTDPQEALLVEPGAPEPPPATTEISGEIPPPPPVPPEAPWGIPPSEPIAGTVTPAPKPSRKRPLLIAGAGVVILGIIIGVAMSGGGGDKTAVTDSPSASVAPSPSSAPPPIVASPVGFTAEGQTDPFGVVLTWSAPVGQSLQGYRIYRAGIQIAAVPSGTTTYLDSNVTPGHTYTYEILTRGEDVFQSVKVSTDVKVPVPALSTARVDGTFSSKLKTTSQFGYVGSLGHFTLGWNFNPKCKQGACTVTLKDLSIKDLKTTLTRKGVDYGGTDSAKFLGSCGGVAQTSTLTIDLKVVKARMIDGEWRATKLTGTVVESHPSALGCTSGGAHFSVTATFTG